MPPQQAPTSFIPKKPLDAPTAYHESGGFGFLFFIALFVFLASSVVAGGVFTYERYLKGSIADQKASLAKEQAAFDPDQIDQLVRLDTRINNAKTLLVTHVAPSAIFAFLSQQTLQKVQFLGFTYTLNTDGTAGIMLTGVADSFATVALQSDQFNAATQILKDVVFSNVNNTSEGKVNFSVAATAGADFISYAKNLGVAGVVVPVPTTPVATTTATTTSR